jgi:hypothetical protein
MDEVAHASSVKAAYSDELLALPGVSGVGTERDEDTGEIVLAVHYDAEQLDVPEHLPASLDGVRVKPVPSGPFFAGPARGPA